MVYYPHRSSPLEVEKVTIRPVFRACSSSLIGKRILGTITAAVLPQLCAQNLACIIPDPMTGSIASACFLGIDTHGGRSRKPLVALESHHHACDDAIRHNLNPCGMAIKRDVRLDTMMGLAVHVLAQKSRENAIGSDNDGASREGALMSGQLPMRFEGYHSSPFSVHTTQGREGIGMWSILKKAAL